MKSKNGQNKKTLTSKRMKRRTNCHSYGCCCAIGLETVRSVRACHQYCRLLVVTSTSERPAVAPPHQTPHFSRRRATPPSSRARRTAPVESERRRRRKGEYQRNTHNLRSFPLVEEVIAASSSCGSTLRQHFSIHAIQPSIFPSFIPHGAVRRRQSETGGLRQWRPRAHKARGLLQQWRGRVGVARLRQAKGSVGQEALVLPAV